MMEENLKNKTEESIKRILDEGITNNNLEYLYKLTKINKMAKEEENMYNGNYNEYGRGNYNNYGREYNESYNDYGRRGIDSKYRGYGHIDRMYNEYGRYMDGRERYGANEDTKKSLKYMLESMEDFARMLKEDAKSQEEVQMIRETAQRIAQM